MFVFSAEQSRTTNSEVGLPAPFTSWFALATAVGYGPRISFSGSRNCGVPKKSRKYPPGAETSISPAGSSPVPPVSWPAPKFE